MYVSTSTAALSANPTVTVPLRTINGWILMQRKVTGGSVSFNHNWIDYRDGFGSPAQDNYWLGLDKVYRLMQLGNTRLRVEVKMEFSALSTFSVVRIKKEGNSVKRIVNWNDTQWSAYVRQSCRCRNNVTIKQTADCS